MINASELSIGNCVFINHLTPVQIVGLERLDNSHIPCVSDGEREFKVSLSVLSPIPLSPEVLAKCGFMINENAGNWHSHEHTIYTHSELRFSVGVSDDCIGWWNSTDDDFYSTIYPRFETLHHLQNFIHCFTGKELKYIP